jgi:hypothetical protein
MPEAWSFPIFLRATMPQVQSPDAAEGSGCRRLRVYFGSAVRPRRTTETRWRLPLRSPWRLRKWKKRTKRRHSGGIPAAATRGGCDDADLAEIVTTF